MNRWTGELPHPLLILSLSRPPSLLRVIIPFHQEQRIHHVHINSNMECESYTNTPGWLCSWGPFTNLNRRKLTTFFLSLFSFSSWIHCAKYHSTTPPYARFPETDCTPPFIPPSCLTLISPCRIRLKVAITKIVTDKPSFETSHSCTPLLLHQSTAWFAPWRKPLPLFLSFSMASRVDVVTVQL